VLNGKNTREAQKRCLGLSAKPCRSSNYRYSLKACVYEFGSQFVARNDFLTQGRRVQRKAEGASTHRAVQQIKN